MKEHYKEVCPTCGIVIRQCRCRGPKVSSPALTPCTTCLMKASHKDKDEVQKNLPTDIYQGQRWKHYKGGEYEIVSLGIKEDTGEQVVVYKSLSYGTVWVRNLDNWREAVLTESGPVKRFVPLEVS